MQGPVRWVANAPERASLLAIPAAWTAAEIMHATGVPGVDVGLGTGLVAALAYAGGYRWASAERARHLATAAGIAGGWLTLADVTGPLAGWHHALTWGAVVAGLVGFRWLVAQGPIQELRERRRYEAEQARLKAEWQEDAYWWGVPGSVLVERHETRLGERIIIDARGTRARAGRASSISKQGVAATIEEHYLLPHGRVAVEDYKYRGWYRIDIRKLDPWKEPIPHPVLVDDHEIELDYPADIREPQPVGQDPVTGDTLPFTLYTGELGALNVMVAGMKGSAKSALLSDLKERITAAPNATFIQINLSKAREEQNWAPAALLNAIGPEDGTRAVKILRAVRAVIYLRSQMPRDTPNLIPSPDHKHITVFIDEVQDALAFPEVQFEAEKIATSGRGEAVSLVVSGQRGIAQFMGRTLRTQVDEFWAGTFNRPSEVANALGAFAEMVPDMTTYGEGKPGVFASVNVRNKGTVHKGRVWRLDNPRDLERIAVSRAGAQGDLEPEIVARLGPDYEELLATDAWSRMRRGEDYRGPLNRNVTPVTVAPADPGPEPALSPAGGVTTLEHDPTPSMEAMVDEAFSAIDPALKRGLDEIAQRNAASRREFEATPFPHAELSDDAAKGAWQAWNAERWAGETEKNPVPPGAEARILELAGEGTTIGAVAEDLKIKPWTARVWMEGMAGRRVLHVAGRGRGRRWWPGPGPDAATESDDAGVSGS